MYKTVQINYCRKVFCVTAYPCVFLTTESLEVSFGLLDCFYTGQSPDVLIVFRAGQSPARRRLGVTGGCWGVWKGRPHPQRVKSTCFDICTINVSIRVRGLHLVLLALKLCGGCPKLLFPQRPLGPSLRQPCAFLARPHSRITFIISVVFHHYSRTCFRMLNI